MARKVREGESTEVDTASAVVNSNPLMPDVWYELYGGYYESDGNYVDWSPSGVASGNETELLEENGDWPPSDMSSSSLAFTPAVPPVLPATLPLLPALVLLPLLRPFPVASPVCPPPVLPVVRLPVPPAVLLSLLPLLILKVRRASPGPLLRNPMTMDRVVKQSRNRRRKTAILGLRKKILPMEKAVPMETPEVVIVLFLPEIPVLLRFITREQVRMSQTRFLIL